MTPEMVGSTDCIGTHDFAATEANSPNIAVRRVGR